MLLTDYVVNVIISLLKNRVWGLKSKEEQLRVLMAEHMVLVSPLFHGQLLTKTPMKKRPAKQQRMYKAAVYS